HYSMHILRATHYQLPTNHTRETCPLLTHATAKKAQRPRRDGPPCTVNRLSSPGTICEKRQPPVADRARGFAPTARAIPDCVRAFSRNQFPDQTQSPSD